MHESPSERPLAAPLPAELKPYIVLETESADVGPGSRLGGWWVLAWRARLPVLQLGRGRSRPVPRAVLHAADHDPDSVRAALAEATLFVTTERRHLVTAGELDLPTIFVADGNLESTSRDTDPAVLLGVPPESEAFVPGCLEVLYSDTAWRRDLCLRLLFEACDRMSPGLFPEGHGESAACRERLLPYLGGRLADLGHGGCKILPEAVGVDFFRYDEQDWIGDVRDLWFFADASFDSVFSSHCLEDLWHPCQALDEWARVLKPGGHLSLYLPLRDHYPNVGTEGANPGHKDDYVCADVEDFLERVGGFELVRSEPREAEDSFEIVARRKAARTVVPGPAPAPRLSVLVDGPCTGQDEIDGRALLAAVEGLRAGLGDLDFEVLVRQRAALRGDVHAALRDLEATDPRIRMFEDRSPEPLPQRLAALRDEARGKRILVLAGDGLFLGDGARRLYEAAEREDAALVWPLVVGIDGAPVEPEVPPCALLHPSLLDGLADRPFHTLLLLHALAQDAQAGGGRVLTVPEALLLHPGRADRPLAARRLAPQRFDRQLLARGPRPRGTREEILLYVLRTFGDCLLVTPTLQALRAAHPEARLTVACEQAYAWIFATDPCVDALIAIDGDFDRDLCWNEDRALCRVLDEGPGYDRLILCSDRSDVVSYHHSGFDLAHFYALQAGLPEAARIAPRLCLPAAAGDEARTLLLASGLRPDMRYATLHTRSGWKLKDLEPELAHAIVDELRGRHGLAVVQLGAAGEGLDEPGGDDDLPPFIDLCGRLDMAGSAALIAGASLHVGPDSGPLHLASCFDVPTLGLYAGSGVRVAPPTSPRSVAMQSASSCALSCGTARCTERRPCASGFDPFTVSRALDDLLVGASPATELHGARPAPYVRSPDGPRLIPPTLARDPQALPTPLLDPPAKLMRLPVPASRPVPGTRRLSLDERRADWPHLLQPEAPARPAGDDQRRSLVAGLEVLLERLSPWSGVALLRRLADLAALRLDLDDALRFAAVALGRAAAIERGVLGRARAAFRILAEEILADALARIHGLDGSLATAATLCDLCANESRGTIPLGLLASVVAAAPAREAGAPASLRALLESQETEGLGHAEALVLARALARLGGRDRAIALLEERLGTLAPDELRLRAALALELGLVLAEDPRRLAEAMHWLAVAERDTEDGELRVRLAALRAAHRSPDAQARDDAHGPASPVPVPDPALLAPRARPRAPGLRRLADAKALAAHFGLVRPGRLLEPDLDVEENECEAGGRKRRDAEVLCLLAANAQGDVLDLGTSHGRSAFKLATNVGDGARVFTVNALPGQLGTDEVHVTHRLPIQDIGTYYRARGCANVVQLYANTRDWQPPATIRDLGLVFVDASHDEEAVLSDSRLAWSLLRPGGFLAWHDFCPDRRATWAWIDAVMRGVERFVDGLGASVEPVWIEGSWTAVLRKPEGRDLDGPDRGGSTAGHGDSPTETCIGSGDTATRGGRT